MNIRIAAVAACIAMSGVMPASANIITVVYTGTSDGLYTPPLPNPLPPSFDLSNGRNVDFVNVSTTETYVFDTSKGTLTFDGSGGFTLKGGNVSAAVYIFGIPNSTNPLLPNSPNPLDFGTTGQNSLVVSGQQIDTPNEGGDGFHNQYVIGGHGGFQSATCPGGICGLFTASSVTITGNLPVASPVPLPVAGGGLPGLLGLGWLFWKRRRFR